LITEDVDESVSDPRVHPAVDDRIKAGVRQGQQVNGGKEVGESPVVQD